MPEKIKAQMHDVIQAGLSAACTIYVKTRKKSWSGSGFHIGKGLVVTASHVCPEKNLEINITFDSKIFFPCSVVATDPSIDAAILKIQGDYSKISTVALANSDTIEKGDIVAVIGAPEGWSDTVTQGIVSNVHQSMGNAAPSPAWQDIILIDAKILMGVSGGMCIGSDGLVVGSIMGVTGELAAYGIGQNVICPSNKILNLIKSLK